jgi:hypothetical protein
MHTIKPPAPETKDTTARTLIWITLIITTINALLSGYVFLVVHRTIEVLHQLGDAFNQIGQ